MFVNTTKTTLPVLKIAIAWNDEEGFTAINKIIKLCKWMRLNFIFEPIDVAGQNYQKNMVYGIDEDNLTRLKNTDIFFHTKLDYSFFDKNKHTNVEEYIDIAMENCNRIYFFDKQKLQKETFFFTENKQYIKNACDFELKSEVKDDGKSSDILSENYDFYQSVGHKYTVFAVNEIDEKSLMRCFEELLDFVGLGSKNDLLKKFENCQNAIQETINFLQKNNVKNVSCVEKQMFKLLPEIEFVDVKKSNDNGIEITEKHTQFEGKFVVSDLVSMIKEGEIKVAEDLYLYQIFANGVEVYPNVNFWDAVVFNPVVICKTHSENKIEEVKFGDFF